jgi:mannose-6-phosphate isomerase-like protein (cupin superfamily)
MHNFKSLLNIFFLMAIMPALSHATGATNMNNITQPMVAEQIYDKVRSNNNWKSAFATGAQAQVVFMSVSPATNPNNEIGMETHKFDQIIFVVEGNGNAVLNGKTSAIKEGDMIFIPLGTAHNIVNLNKDKELKILSVYSGNDIAADAMYKKNTDEPKD